VRHDKPFGRKDKLKEHVNVHEHGAFHCSYDHCEWKRHPRFLSKSDAVVHEMGDSHGEFECAIGMCEGTISCFTASRLVWHLQSVHRLKFSMLSHGLDRLKPDMKIATLADVNNLGDEWYFEDPKVVKTTCNECEKSGRNSASRED